MPKYTVAASQFAHGRYIDGDEVDGKTPRVWQHTGHTRGDTVELSEKDAEQHLADGTLSKSKDDAPADQGQETSPPAGKK